MPVQDLSPESTGAWPFSSLSLWLGLFSSVSRSGVAAPEAIAACKKIPDSEVAGQSGVMQSCMLVGL
jgi:hypothetical protein